MKKTLICCFICLQASICLSQEKAVRSPTELKLLLQRSIADTSRVKLLLELAMSYLSNKNSATYFDSTLVYGLQAASLAQSLKSYTAEGASYLLVGKIFTDRKDLEKGKIYAQKAVDIFSKYGPPAQLADAYVALSKNYLLYGSGLSEIIRLCTMASNIYHTEKNNLNEAFTLKTIGRLLMYQGRMEDALVKLKQGLAIYRSAGYQSVQDILSLIGANYTQTGNYKEALSYGLEAVATSQSVGDTSTALGVIYNYLAVTYQKIGQLADAGLYLKKAFAIAEKGTDLPLVVMLATNISFISMQLNKPQEALSYMTRLTTNYPEPKDLNARAQISSNFLNIYLQLNDRKNASIYCSKLLALSGKYAPDDAEQLMMYPLICHYYLKYGQYDEARQYFSLLKDISEKKHMIGYQRTAYLLGFQLDSAQGHYLSAIDNYKLYKHYNDSLYNETKSKQIAQLQIEYETEKKDRDIKLKEQDIALLTKQGQLQLALSEKKDRDLELKGKDIELLTRQQELQQAETEKKDQFLKLKDQDMKLQERDIDLLKSEGLIQQAKLKQTMYTRNITIGGAVMLLLLLLLGYNRYRLKQRTNNQLKMQQTEINQKNIYLEHLVDEKEWLLKEIHHRVKNNLQIIMSLLNSQSAYLENGAALAANQESQHRVYSMSLIHQKLYNADNFSVIEMHSYILELVAYLRDCFNTGQRIRFNVNVEPIELDVSQAVPLGLILNEAITNCIKYAFPENKNGTINITLVSTAENHYLLTIADNGIGMPGNYNGEKPGSLGISLMKGLSEDLDGSLNIENNNGTVLKISFVLDLNIKRISTLKLASSNNN